MADVWNSATEGGGWVLCFSRPFNDWEMESAECLLVQLQEKGAYRYIDDKVIWIESKCGKFSIKSFFVSEEYHLEFLCAT